MIPNYARLERMLTRDEHRGDMDGQLIYFCPSKKLTFGIGRNVEDRKVWFIQGELNHGKKHGMDAMVDLCLLHDAQDAYRAVCNLFGWDYVEEWHERRIHAVTNAMFCLGGIKFRRFVKMIGAIRNGWWDDAAKELLDSKWWREKPERPQRLSMEFCLSIFSEYD